MFPGDNKIQLKIKNNLEKDSYKWPKKTNTTVFKRKKEYRKTSFKMENLYKNSNT